MKYTSKNVEKHPETVAVGITTAHDQKTGDRLGYIAQITLSRGLDRLSVIRSTIVHQNIIDAWHDAYKIKAAYETTQATKASKLATDDTTATV